MRHNMHGRKLGRTSTHRIAMLRNMATSLFRHERITTTVQKAKTLRPFAEKLITLAKRETIHARRLVNRHIQDKEVLSKLFSDIGVRFATRPGGYTRIIKTTFRRGDNAEMAIIELVGEDMTSKPKKRKAAKKKAAPKKDAAKKVATAEPVVEEAETPAEEAGAAAATAAQEAAAAAEEATEEVKADAAEEAPAEEKPAEEAEEKDEKAEEDKKE